MKTAKMILNIASIILSIITIGYCIATWRDDDEDIIEVEVVE